MLTLFIDVVEVGSVSTTGDPVAYKAIELDPKDANTYRLRALAFSRLKDYERAIADFTKAIEIDPKFAVAYFNRGVAFGSLGEIEKAEADFKKAYELDPSLKEN